MNEYNKEEFLVEVLEFFETAKNEMGHPVPYTKEGVVETLNQQGWEYIKEHWINASEDPEEDNPSIMILYEFSQKVVESEVLKVAIELEKEGVFESGIDEKGEVTFYPKKNL